jgi:hypothetical protein
MGGAGAGSGSGSGAGCCGSGAGTGLGMTSGPPAFGTFSGLPHSVASALLLEPTSLWQIGFMEVTRHVRLDHRYQFAQFRK